MAKSTKKPSTSDTAKIKALVKKGVKGKTATVKEGEEGEGEGEISYKKAVIEVPKTRYKKPTEYSISRVGLEVYVTDEENYEPYVPIMSGSVAEEDEDEEKKEEETEEDEEETEEVTDEESEDEDDPGYKLHMGEILSTTYWGKFESASFESDYKEMTASSTLKIKEIDLEKSYKGVRVHLLSAWDKGTSEKFEWKNLESAVLGFITEQSFADSQITIKLSGMTKTMDMKYKFDFKQMRRSEIINQVILTAGLKPFINVDGLDDDITDFSNISSSGSGDSGSSDTPGIGNAEIDDLVKKWCKGKTSDLEKAKAVHAGLRDEVGIVYSYYYNSKYHTPENCLKHHDSPGLNCGDTSILTTACMKSAGLNAYIVLRCDSAHFFTVIEISGTKYYSDLTWSEGARSQRPWNEVWEGNTCGNKYDLS